MAPTPRAPHSFWQTLNKTEILLFPRHRLATFGRTEINYQLVTSVSRRPQQANLRTGTVIAERPQIITPDRFAQRFEGFSEENAQFESFLKNNFGDSFRGLEYTFRNNLETIEVRPTDARELADVIRADIAARDVSRSAVIVGPEQGWGFSLMKFILEETSQSFVANFRELSEHGFFNPEFQTERRRREANALFRRAETNPSLIKPLADLLKRYDLFEEFQDRFFTLVR